MNKSIFNNEKSYLMSLEIAKMLLKDGLITDKEFNKIKEKLLSCYNPLISSFIDKNKLDKT